MFLAKAFQTDPRPRQEAQTLVADHYQVSCIAWDRESEFNPIEDSDGVTVRSIHPLVIRKPSAIGLAFGVLIFQLLLVFESVRLIHHYKARPIVHAHDFNTLLPACLLKTLGLTSGFIYDSHELSYAAYEDFYGPKMGLIVRVIEERCLHYPDVIITVSPPFARYLRRFNKQTEIIYNCPRASDIPKQSKRNLREELNMPLGAFIVSFIGTINDLFPTGLFLAVASMLSQERKILFLVVGSGPLAPKFTEDSKRSNAKMMVMPQVSHEEALRYVTASDLTWAVYIKRSLNARLTIPWKLYESMACKVPLLAEDGTLTASMVANMGCGLVVKSEPAIIARSISNLSEDTELQARLRPTAGYTWEMMATRLTEIYSQIQNHREIADSRKEDA